MLIFTFTGFIRSLHTTTVSKGSKANQAWIPIVAPTKSAIELSLNCLRDSFQEHITSLLFPSSVVSRTPKP